MNRLEKSILCITYTIAICLTLCGCPAASVFTEKQESGHTDREYSVIVQDSDFFTAIAYDNKVKAGETFTAELVYKYGYSYEACNYEEAVIEDTQGGVRITIDDVEHDYRLVITSKCRNKEAAYPETGVTIRYHANNGQWADGEEVHTETYILSYHFRPNTSTGGTLTRDGYTLVGWNTKPDGKGEHIGLGSRTDSTELYAEWLPWTDEKSFTYRRTQDGIVLTGYKGSADVDPLVLPKKIDGLDVVEIDSSFTSNMPCKALTGSTLVLPESIKRIKSKAFENAAFSELFFYDSLDEVEEGAFSDPIATYHINAALPPAFQAENDNARFADKIDYLIRQDKKRLIIFGGCSVAYGIDSELMQTEFPDYAVCNMGVIGGVNAIFQMQIIGNYLRAGDMFVHIPEQMSPFQLMAYMSVDYRVFIMVEGNYDLLALADFSYAASFWDGYNSYKRNKNSQTPGSYSDGRITYNAYGDIMAGRLYDEQNAWERDISYSGNSYRFDSDCITQAGIERLCGFYDSYKSDGVDVYIGYAPVNIDGIDNIAEADEYERLFCEELLKNGYRPMGKMDSHLFRGRYFYDADYHLNGFGALLQTEALIGELTEAMEG